MPPVSLTTLKRAAFLYCCCLSSFLQWNIELPQAVIQVLMLCLGQARLCSVCDTEIAQENCSRLLVRSFWRLMIACLGHRIRVIHSRQQKGLHSMTVFLVGCCHRQEVPHFYYKPCLCDTCIMSLCRAKQLATNITDSIYYMEGFFFFPNYNRTLNIFFLHDLQELLTVFVPCCSQGVSKFQFLCLRLTLHTLTNKQ